MHLMHATWFNGAHHRWRKTSGEHSTTISVTLKRSNDFWARRSIGCLAPPLSFLTYLSVLFPGLSAAVPPMSELYGFGVIRVAWPLAFATPVADLCWGGTYWRPSSPIRLDDFALRRHPRRGDVVIDRGHIDPVKNGDAFWDTGLTWPLWQTGRTR